MVQSQRKLPFGKFDKSMWKKIVKVGIALIIIVSAVFVIRNGNSDDTVTAAALPLENLGTPLRTNTIDRQAMFPLNGDMHLLLMYTLLSSTSQSFQLVDVNMIKNTARLVDAGPGRPGPHTVVVHPNGKVYIASGGNPGLGYFISYDPASGTVKQYGALADRLGQFGEVGGDGAVYIGEATQGTVQRFDPATNTLTSLGRMDPSYTKNPIQYAYSLGADKRYVYVALGQDPWYLAIYDLQTKSIKLLFKDQNDTYSAVRTTKAGALIYQRGSSNPQYYTLANGQATAMPAGTNPPFAMTRGGLIDDPYYYSMTYNYTTNLDSAFPDTGNGDMAVIRWQKGSTTNWQAVTVGGFALQDTKVKELYSLNSTTLIGLGEYYTPVFTFNTTTKAVTSLGRPQRSLYDGFVDGTNVYLAGYPATFLKYDFTKPWSLTSQITNIDQTTINPHNLEISGSGVSGKYFYFLAKGSDKKIYMGVHHERDSVGGALGWYDPATGNSGGLRSPFMNDDVADLATAQNGQRIVYSSKSLNGSGKIFVYDIASGQIIHTYTPISGTASAGQIVEAETNMILGVTGSTLYKMNLNTGAIVFKKSLGGTAFVPGQLATDNRLVKGPDGKLWVFVGTTLYRIRTTDGTMQKVLTMSAGNIVFQGNDLYVYNTAIYRIKNVAALLPPL